MNTAPTEEARTIKKKAFSYLSRRDYTQAALTKKLEALGYSSSLVAQIMEELKRLGMVDDLRYCENYTRRRREQGYGPKRISLELKQHGIAPENMREFEAISNAAWLEDGRKILNKRFKTIDIPDMNPVSLAKQQRFLAYRGFTTEQIYQLLKDRYE